MKSTIEIISILKRLKKDSAYKYGIKPFVPCKFTHLIFM